MEFKFHGIHIDSRRLSKNSWLDFTSIFTDFRRLYGIILELNSMKPAPAETQRPRSPSTRWKPATAEFLNKVGFNLKILLYKAMETTQSSTEEEAFEFEVRKLEISDKKKGFVELLQQLTVCDSISDEAFDRRFEEVAEYGDDHLICVVEDRDSGRIIATGSVLIEKKFTHIGESDEAAAESNLCCTISILFCIRCPIVVWFLIKLYWMAVRV